MPYRKVSRGLTAALLVPLAESQGWIGVAVLVAAARGVIPPELAARRVSGCYGGKPPRITLPPTDSMMEFGYRQVIYDVLRWRVRKKKVETQGRGRFREFRLVTPAPAGEAPHETAPGPGPLVGAEGQGEGQVPVAV